MAGTQVQDVAGTHKRHQDLPVGSRGMSYVPGLDGLRAVAVLGVMVYHLKSPWLQGGFLGVDAFFVLSGFLITGLLLQERARTGRNNLMHFWGRRARRLFPALCAMLLAVCVYAVFATEVMQQTIRDQGIATLFYVNNWWIILTGGTYFNDFKTPSPLLHTWSLGVEEQWYFVFPVALAAMLAWRVRRDARLVILLVFAAVAALLWTIYLAQRGATLDRLYMGTDVRMQELLVGAALAAAVHVAARRDQPLVKGLPAQVGGVVAAFLLLLAFVFARDTDRSLYYGGMFLFSVVVAVLIASLIAPQSNGVQAVLGSRGMRAIGLISYGLYLWHWPVYVILTPEVAGVSGFALAASKVALTFLLAIASYHWLERPIRRGALRRAFGPQGPVSVAIATVVVLIAAVMVSTNAGATAKIVNSGLTWPAAATIPQRVFIAGDSIALAMAVHNGSQWVPSMTVSNYARMGCGLVPGTTVFDGVPNPFGNAQCEGWQQGWRTEVQRNHPEASIIVPGIWDLADRKIDDRIIMVGTPEHHRLAVAAYKEAIQAAGGGSGVDVYITNESCYNYAQASGENRKLGATVDDPFRQAALNSAISEAVSQSPGAHIIDLRSYLCPNGKYEDLIDGVQLRPDSVHPSEVGSERIWNLMLRRIAETWKPPQPVTTKPS